MTDQTEQGEDVMEQSIAVDRLGNQIRMGDIVRIVSGPMAGASHCRVTWLHNDSSIVGLDLGFVTGSFDLSDVELNLPIPAMRSDDV